MPSPGEIDGTLGENTRKAIAAYTELKGLEPTEQITEELWRAIIEKDTRWAAAVDLISPSSARARAAVANMVKSN